MVKLEKSKNNYRGVFSPLFLRGNMNEKFKNLLKEIKEDRAIFEKSNLNSRILVVDGLNNFIRTWVMTPTINEDGLHIGGITGFLKTLGVSIRTLNPTRLILVFDGKDGSKKRKKLYSGYKGNRGHSVRLNRTYDWSSDAEEEEQMIRQLTRSIQYLSNLPCTIMMLNGIEADDTIGYIATELCENNKDVEKMWIMSSDKDFYQLISDKVVVWNPIKKQIIDKKKILEDYQIYPHNFLLFKAMNGDSSDNLPGIKGVGNKTGIKHFPLLTEQRQIVVNDVISYALGHQNSSRLCKQLIDNKEQYLLNYKIMKLTGGEINKSAALKIIELFNNPVKKTNIKSIQNLVMEDKLWTAFPNINSWISTNFSQLNYFASK